MDLCAHCQIRASFECSFCKVFFCESHNSIHLGEYKDHSIKSLKDSLSPQLQSRAMRCLGSKLEMLDHCSNEIIQSTKFIIAEAAKLGESSLKKIDEYRLRYLYLLETVSEKMFDDQLKELQKLFNYVLVYEKPCAWRFNKLTLWNPEIIIREEEKTVFVPGSNDTSNELSTDEHGVILLTSKDLDEREPPDGVCITTWKRCRKCNPQCLNCGNLFEGPGNTCSNCLNCIRCKQYPKILSNNYCSQCYNRCNQCGEATLINQCPSCNQYHCSACLKHLCSVCFEMSCTKCSASSWNECKIHYPCSKCTKQSFLERCRHCEMKCSRCEEIFYRRDLSQVSCGHKCCNKCQLNAFEFCRLCPIFGFTRCYNCGSVNRFINDTKKRVSECFTCKKTICLKCGSKRSDWSIDLLHQCNYDHFPRTD